MSHQIRVEDHVYERIKENKRDDESFSEAVERLIGGRSLRDLHDVFNEEQVAGMRGAILVQRENPAVHGGRESRKLR